MPAADEFRDELYRAMHEGFSRGSEYIEMETGDLHRCLGGYPGPDHRSDLAEYRRRSMRSAAGQGVIQSGGGGFRVFFSLVTDFRATCSPLISSSG
jgi:hypothetical protein